MKPLSENVDLAATVMSVIAVLLLLTGRRSRLHEPMYRRRAIIVSMVISSVLAGMLHVSGAASLPLAVALFAPSLQLALYDMLARGFATKFGRPVVLELQFPLAIRATPEGALTLVYFVAALLVPLLLVGIAARISR